MGSPFRPTLILCLPSRWNLPKRERRRKTRSPRVVRGKHPPRTRRKRKRERKRNPKRPRKRPRTKSQRNPRDPSLSIYSIFPIRRRKKRRKRRPSPKRSSGARKKRSPPKKPKRSKSIDIFD